MESIKKILPSRISKALDGLDASKVYELRLRLQRVSVNYGGRFFGLSDVGLGSGGFTVTASEIEEVMLKASGHSIYAVNEQIKSGFLCLSGGIRIGVCGEVVLGKTIKNFTSLNIRFPHEVVGCAGGIIGLIARERGCYNTLIVSAPGIGKTTLLRDLARQLSNRGSNVLIADERYEIAAYNDGKSLDVGKNTDVISGTSKDFAFSQGIRYMRPDIIAVDEITSNDDVKAVCRACSSGVSVIATIHASGFEYKNRFLELNCFQRIVVLGGGVGQIQGVFDGNGERI
ncbi:MAG: Flp pilus assembly complex ATPase component TadA [Clostridia bacterium]|nr:Flp pilus assembly complex ATPase component TadA [Clostridia bacterium]